MAPAPPVTFDTAADPVSIGASASAQGDASITSPVLIVQTYLVSTPRGDFYEIHTAPDAAQDAKRTVYYTRNARLYEDALRLEGFEQRVRVRWHYGPRPAGGNNRCPIAVGIVRVEPGL